jgi:hypothetical protein
MTTPIRTSLALLALALAAAGWAPAAEKKIVATDPAAAGEDFKFQGEYAGQYTGDDGTTTKVGVQVIALGKGTFEGVGYVGGLPGDGGTKSTERRAKGTLEGGTVTFRDEDQTGVLRDGVMTVTAKDGKEVARLKKVERKSPTLGAKPPAGAIVLFDGGRASAERWEAHGAGGAKDGLLLQGNKTKEKFQGCTLHLEFMTPFMPEARGQERGNSGCYLQGRYEVQILDSFGLEPRDNECGGIYSVGPPRLNMCFPPLAWQTYDIDFTAAKFDGAGKKTADARMTVRHNGVPIHDGQVVDHATTASIEGVSPNPGPVYVQDHGCPVRFRNIWIVRKD